MQEFDVLVIGGGPGGYVAAIRAAKNGAKTALVERKEFGGTCLNIGCIPTKTLIAGVDVYHKARHAMEFGVKISGEVSPDWEAMLARKDSVIKTLRGGIGSLLKAAGVTVFKGHGAFTGRKTVKVVDGEGGEVEEITANKIIIASGSETLVPGFIPKGKRVITSTELLSIPEIPKSLLILGGGVIGCEFACLFAELDPLGPEDMVFVACGGVYEVGVGRYLHPRVWVVAQLGLDDGAVAAERDLRKGDPCGDIVDVGIFDHALRGSRERDRKCEEKKHDPFHGGSVWALWQIYAKQSVKTI